MEDLICEAIDGRRVVSLRDGRDGGGRLCRPRVLDEGPTGKPLVDRCRVGSRSSSGSVPGRKRYVRIVCAV